jgi:hypothetical protein
MDRRQLLQAQQKRKERADVIAFSPLIATPAADSFTMLANGRVRFVSIGGCAANTIAAVLTGKSTRTIRTPLLSAGGSVKLDMIEKDVAVNPAAGFRVELDCGYGVWRQIATGA